MTPTFTSFSNPGCQDVDRDPDPESPGYNHAIVAHLGYLMRYIDFGDTLFFILRKKFDNVSALQGSTINKFWQAGHGHRICEIVPLFFLNV